jgi:hypothetical protein
MAPSYLKEVVLLQFACTAPAPYLLQSALDSYEHRVRRMCRVNGTFWEQCVTKTVVAVWEQQGKLGAAATAAALALLGAVSWGWQDSPILVDIVTSSCTSGLLCPGIIVCVKSLVRHRLDVDDDHKTAPVVVSWLQTIMQRESSELLALCRSMDVLGNIVNIACDIHKIVDSETHPDVASGLFSVRVACKLLCLGVARYGFQHATCISGLFFRFMFHANLCPVTCATVATRELQGALDSLIQLSAVVHWESCAFFAWVFHKCNLLAAPVKDVFVHPVDTAWNTRLWNVLNDSIPFLGRIHRPWVENWMMELIPSLCEMPSQLNNLSSALQQAVIQQVVCDRDRDRDRAAGGHTYRGYANLPPPVLVFFFCRQLPRIVCHHLGCGLHG